MADSTRLVLIRHGESRATVDEIVGGHDGCQGLTDRGRRQAEALRDRLVATGELADTAALYASILPRAVETGEIIAPALGHPELVSDCAFCEQHPGEADGMSWAEYTERYREERTGFDPYVADAPGQESWAEFVARGGRRSRRLWPGTPRGGRGRGGGSPARRRSRRHPSTSTKRSSCFRLRHS